MSSAIGYDANSARSTSGYAGAYMQSSASQYWSSCPRYTFWQIKIARRLQNLFFFSTNTGGTRIIELRPRTLELPLLVKSHLFFFLSFFLFSFFFPVLSWGLRRSVFAVLSPPTQKREFWTSQHEVHLSMSPQWA